MCIHLVCLQTQILMVQISVLVRLDKLFLASNTSVDYQLDLEKESERSDQCGSEVVG